MRKSKKMIGGLLGLVAVVAVLISGCSRTPSLKPSASTYHADGLVAVVKGTISKDTKLTYQVGTAKAKTAKQNDKTFVIQIPTQLKQTKVKLIAKRDGKKVVKTVTIAKSKPLISSAQFVMSYNMINLKMKTGATQVTLPTKNGITDLVNDSNGLRIRANISDNQVVSIAYIFPMSKMKSKTEVKKFAMQLVALASSTGADGEKVLKAYQKLAKDAENGQTTVDNIHSKGVTFETNFSTKALYMYLIKS